MKRYLVVMAFRSLFDELNVNVEHVQASNKMQAWSIARQRKLDAIKGQRGAPIERKTLRLVEVMVN